MSRLVRKRGPAADLDNVVVVIEDDDHLRENLGYLFKREGIRALFAADGRSGLALIRRHRPKVAVLDVYVPHMSGFEVIDELRRDILLAKVFVVAITGMADDADELRALRGAADTILTKPLNEDYLIDIIRAGFADPGTRLKPARRPLHGL
jgi:DNA-binding response OmpR family regulator